MALIVITANICIDGFLYDLIEDTATQVLTDVTWNASSELTNTKHASILKPHEDPQGDYILGDYVLTDPDWNLTPEPAFLVFKAGYTLKNHFYYQPLFDINGDPIPCP